MELRQRLQAEHQILERIARGAPLRETLDALVLLIEAQSRDILCSVLLLDSEHGCLRHGAAPSLPPSYIDRLDGARIGPREGSCGAAAFHAETVIAEDILTHPNWTAYRELATAHSLRACWSAPIFATGGAVLGTFANYYRVPRTPSDEEREWVEVATHLASIAITRARTTQALERAEAHAQHIARIHAVATSVSELFVRSSEPAILFEAACRIAVEKGAARLAWVGEYDSDADSLRAIARYGFAAEDVDLLPLGVHEPGYQSTTAKRALATNTPIISNDPSDPEFRWHDEAHARGLRSRAVFPIRIQAEKPAVLVIYGDGEDFFDDEVASVLAALATNIGYAISFGRVNREREGLIRDLNSRVQQLSVVHAVARRLQQSDHQLDETVLSELITTLQPGLRHPDLCEVRLRWKNIRAETPAFRQTEWSRLKPIGSEGALEVAYRDEPPDAEAFSREEREFLRSVADMFGSHFARVTAESEARKREAQLQLANSLAKVGGWTVDLQAHRLLWSDQLFILHELPIGESPKLRDALASCAPEFRPIATAAFDACMRDGTPFDLVLQMITATDRRIWIRAIGSAERDSLGNVVRVHGALQDIDDRRRLEDQLRQAQKMEAVGRVTGGIAHDFNNLLSVILSYAAYVIDGLPAGDAVRADIEQIFAAGKRASELTRQLLTFGRQQPSSPRHLDMTRVMAGIDKMLHRIVGANVKLSVRSAGKLGTVFADRGQVEQVLLNLVVNARDAIRDKGNITIEIADVVLDASYAAEHHDVTAGNYVVVSVSDNGHGMDEATRAKIFEPFFTTKEKGKGTGLGLATVYGIVKQSGGHIWVYSEPAVGTTFKVYLPRTDTPAEESQPPSAMAKSPAPLPTTSPTLLLVEDSDPVRAIAAAVLRRAGYSVLEAASGEAAMDLDRTHQGAIDLLVTDVVLPGTTGRELAKYLVNRRPDLRVLYMSGYSPDAAVANGMLDPGVAYLEKPITPDALLRKVHDTLNHGSSVKPLHILHIDDDELLLTLIARILRRLGYEVTGFTDPAEAVRAFATNPQPFDAVVTDVEMPGLSGFDVVRQLRSIRPDVPVVLTSGAFRDEDTRTAESLQLRSLVVKPNSIDELGRALVAEIGSRRRENASVS